MSGKRLHDCNVRIAKLRRNQAVAVDVLVDENLEGAIETVWEREVRTTAG